MLTLILLAQDQTLLQGVMESLLYSVIGIILAVVAFKVVDWITPGDLSAQISKEGNVAVAVLLGFLVLGICIIIAAALN
jgi:putative membrane protein